MTTDSQISSRLYEALQFTFELQGRQARKGSNIPYMAHLLNVCAMVQQNGGNEDEAIAALLHDSLEDKPEQITRNGIASRFGNHVLKIVEISTDTPEDFIGGEKPPWRQRKEAYINHIRHSDPILLQVTIADKVDNARAMLADYQQIGENLWERFIASQEDIIWYYKECVQAFDEAGVNSTLLKELHTLVDQLSALPINNILSKTDTMSDEKSFNYTIPKQPRGKPISVDEAERLMLKKMKKSENEFLDSLWDLAYFYSRTGEQQVAQKYVERFIANSDDPEKRAEAYLALGQLMEQMKDYEAAITLYSHAFSLEPENTPTWYLINNNLGYCLNQFDRFAEAEGYCRSAIKIDPERHNAYKNLGVSLAGLGQYAEAARNFIKALRANVADPRALKLLEQLFGEHPEIAGEIPDIEAQIQRCQEAVKAIVEYMEPTQGQSEQLSPLPLVISVLIVDDISETRRILRILLDDPRIRIVGEAGDGIEALAQCFKLLPDVVLLNINMPKMNGLVVAEEIISRLADTKVIILSVQDDAAYMRAAMRVGVSDFISKPPVRDELLKSVIRTVY